MPKQQSNDQPQTEPGERLRQAVLLSLALDPFPGCKCGCGGHEPGAVSHCNA